MLVPTDDDAVAYREQRPLIERVMGTHRSFEHLRELLFPRRPKSVRARVADSPDAGMEYLVLSPLDYDVGQPPCDDPPVVDHAGVRAGGARDPAVGAAADAFEHARRHRLRIGRQRCFCLGAARHPQIRPLRQLRSSIVTSSKL